MAAISLYYVAAVCLAILCCLAWLSTLLTLPGNWLVVGLAALFAWWFPVEAGRGIAWQTVGIAAALGGGRRGNRVCSRRGRRRPSTAPVAELSRCRWSARWRAAWSGLVVGLPIPILGPLIVAVFGGAAGAFAGAYLGETWKGRPEADKIAAGQGAFMGRIWGTLGKLAIGAVIVAIVTIDAFI